MTDVEAHQSENIQKNLITGKFPDLKVIKDVYVGNTNFQEMYLVTKCFWLLSGPVLSQLSKIISVSGFFRQILVSRRGRYNTPPSSQRNNTPRCFVLLCFKTSYQYKAYKCMFIFSSWWFVVTNGSFCNTFDTRIEVPLHDYVSINDPKQTHYFCFHWNFQCHISQQPKCPSQLNFF